MWDIEGERRRTDSKMLCCGYMNMCVGYLVGVGDMERYGEFGKMVGFQELLVYGRV